MKYLIKPPAGETIQPKELNFKGTNPATGEQLGTTTNYFTKDNKPWFPIMGEFHFARFPEDYWEEEILKMKAGGIQIVATYIFWIHHEEIEGVFEWENHRNLRRFIELCQKCGVYALLRVGPWCHGECRNGGFPDWLVEKDFELRSDNEGYLDKVRILFSQIFQQAEGLLYKDGGPVMGRQIENEYGHCGGFTGEKGLSHMRTLTRMVKEVGFHVPYYTATGWGGAVVAEGENLPVMGAYADAPWDRSLAQLPLGGNYVFSNLRNDGNIGSDINPNSMYSNNYTFDPNAYPYATAELGGGIMVTKHRRPVITAKDTEAMIFTRIGSGANLIGYYMYHGGTNFIGKLSTLQESKPRDYCDLPILSYDFQGAIGEYGEPHESFGYLKLIHMWLADFGEGLAKTATFIPDFSAKEPGDCENPRISLRYDGLSGYVFLNNYQRHLNLPDKDGLEIEVNPGGAETISFPKFDLKSGQNIALPFNLKIGGTVIEYATGQPLCLINSSTAVFWTYGSTCEYKIAGETFTAAAGTEITAGELKILTISRKDAERAWKITQGGTDKLIVSDNCIIEHAEGYKAILKQQSPSEPPRFELQETRENGDKFYKLTLPELFRNNERDVYLTIDFAGRMANLFINGKLSADWFYTGLDWNVGLKRFHRNTKLHEAEIILQIKPLRTDSPIYVEKPPAFENGTACVLNGLKLTEERDAQQV